MENYFAVLSEDVRHERSLVLQLSLTVDGIIKQSGFMKFEMKVKENLALDKLHTQKPFRKIIIRDLKDKFSNQLKMATTNLKEEPTLLKRTRNDEEIETLTYKSHKHDYEKTSESPMTDNEQITKRHINLRKNLAC